ncbi:hypothetical protein BDE02_12G078500 [Populus trichocarpa]|nr:hypothetical protein BDE02_12G078500 [Populus trichocarpa]
MSAEVVDSNPYSRLMALQRMGIVDNYERIRDFSVAVIGVVAGLLVQNTLKFLLQFGHVSPYLGYNSLKDYFPTMEMRPNPQCSNAACLERQKEYLLEKPAGDAAIRAKMEAEALLVPEGPLHADNEWDISVVDDSEPERTDATSSDALKVLLVSSQLRMSFKNPQLLNQLQLRLMTLKNFGSNLMPLMLIKVQY